MGDTTTDHHATVGQIRERSRISQSIELQAVAHVFKVEKIPDDNDALMDDALAEMEQGCECLIRSGVRFALLKRRVGRGVFLAMLDRRGEAVRRVQETMRVAQLCAVLTPAQMKELAAGAPSKAVILARLKPQTIRQDADAGRLPELLSSSWRDLNDYVKTRSTNAAIVRAVREKIPVQNPDPPLPTDDDSRPYITARDVLISRLARAHAEVDLAFEAFKMFGAEMPEPKKTELLHFVADEARQLSALFDQLRAACLRRGGREISGTASELETLPEPWLAERMTFARNAAELDVLREAVERQGEYGWKGRAVKSMASLVKQIVRPDEDDAPPDEIGTP